jgi:phosphoglycerate dehydrogenase-like enzyme
VLTDARRLDGPDVAEQTFALLLSLTRGKAARTELRGKRLLLVGLGGSGLQIARRADVFGMRVLALDDRATTRPGFVFSLGKLDRLADRLPEADVVVLALPLTEKTRSLIGTKQLQAMKKSAFLVNAAHTRLIDLEALEQALEKKQLAGAGLDTTDIGPLPKAHGLRKTPGVVLTAHTAGGSPQTRERQWRLYRENVRRFAAGEALLCVVEASKKE